MGSTRRSRAMPLRSPSADGDGEIRYIGRIDAAPRIMKRPIGNLATKVEQPDVCSETGPAGYRLHRLMTEIGRNGTLAVPSHVAREPSDCVRTGYRAWPRFRGEMSVSVNARTESTS